MEKDEALAVLLLAGPPHVDDLLIAGSMEVYTYSESTLYSSKSSIVFKVMNSLNSRV